MKKGEARAKILDMLPVEGEKYEWVLADIPTEKMKEFIEMPPKDALRRARELGVHMSASELEKRHKKYKRFIKLIEKAKAPLTFNQLKEKTGIPKATLSENLRKMVSAGEIKGMVDSETLRYNRDLSPAFVRTGMLSWVDVGQVPTVVEGIRHGIPTKLELDPKKHELKTVESGKKFDRVEVFRKIERAGHPCLRKTGFTFEIEKRYLRRGKWR